MDIVHLAAVFLQVRVDHTLQCADGELHLRVGNGDEVALVVPDKLDGVALALTLVGVGVGGLEGLHELLVVHAEEHAVDRLELQRVIVVVDDLDKGEAARQREILLGRLALLLLLIAGLGRGEGVVAVAHGKQ